MHTVINPKPLKASAQYPTTCQSWWLRAIGLKFRAKHSDFRMQRCEFRSQDMESQGIPTLSNVANVVPSLVAWIPHYLTEAPYRRSYIGRSRLIA